MDKQMSGKEATGTAQRAKVIDAGDLRKYRTEIPNTIDDMGLDPYEFRVYVHLKRVAGDDGKCWQSTETIAKHCNMSKGKVSEVKKSLQDKWKLITITEESRPRGGRPYHLITIVDIWPHNFQKYAPSSPGELASSPGEPKNNPIKNNYSSSDEEEASPHKSLLQRFNELMTLLEGDINNKEKNAAVTRFYVALFGCEAGRRPPYSRVGKLCKQHGHARVAQVLWDVVSKSPRGDPLSYAHTVLKGDKRSGRSVDSRGKDGSRRGYYEADPNDPDIQAWLAKRRKRGASD